MVKRASKTSKRSAGKYATSEKAVPKKGRLEVPAGRLVGKTPTTNSHFGVRAGSASPLRAW